MLAQQAVLALGHEHIGTEHLLLGLLDGEGIASRALGGLGVTADGVRDALPAGALPHGFTGQIPFTARAKLALESAADEATELAHPIVGTEHVLLALVRDDESFAVRILRGLGVSTDDVRRAVHDALGGADTSSSSV